MTTLKGERLLNCDDLQSVAQWALDNSIEVALRTVGGNPVSGNVVRVGADFIVVATRPPNTTAESTQHWEGFVIPFGAVDSIRVRYQQR